MRRWLLVLPLTLLVLIAGCGGGNSTPTNVGLFGNWNITMYPTGSTTPAYVFALAISQEGSTNYSGSSITYTGGIAPPSNMCINPEALRATATTSGNNFTMTITDSTTNTVISVQGTLSTQTTTLSGTYSNQASSTCTASNGTMSMVPQ
jgi:hypothetical protein